MIRSKELTNQNVIELLAERLLKKDDIANWAIKCLENGFDSKSLRILAATNSFDLSSETDDYFKRALKELGWNEIDNSDCLIEYSKILARKIVEDKIDPVEASSIIYGILVDLDYPSELQGWFEIDEMISDYNYFLKTGNQGYFYRSEEELKVEIKRVSEELLNL